MISDAGDVLLPGVFLDAVLYPPGATNSLYLSQVELTSSRCLLTIGDEVTEAICTGEFNLLSPDTSVRLSDSFGRDCGLLVSESLRLANLQAWSLGVHTFSPDATPFAAAVCLPNPLTGVSGFLLDDGSVVSGEVWLVGGAGIALSYREHAEPAGTRSVVRVDAVGDPLFRRLLCAPALFQTPRFLERLIVQKGGRSYTLTPENGGIEVRVGGQLSDKTILQICTFDNGIEVRTIGEQLQGV